MGGFALKTSLLLFMIAPTTYLELSTYIQHGKRLVGSLLSKLRIIGPELCVRECQRRKSECSSINYQKVALFCELNAIKPARNSVIINFRFKENPGFFFINISNIPSSQEKNNPCKETSCGERHICSPLKKGTTKCSVVLVDCYDLEHEGVTSEQIFLSQCFQVIVMIDNKKEESPSVVDAVITGILTLSILSVLTGDCYDLHREGVTSYGVYRIYRNSYPFDVKCRMHLEGTNDAGWTIIQRRKEPMSMAVNRTWTYYKEGFGNLNSEFWLGNEFLHLLTWNRSMEVLINLQAQNGSWYNARYAGFSVGPESDKYRLYFNESSYEGSAGDGLRYSSTRNANGMQFTTRDQDHDRAASLNCAAWLGGGWWFNECSVSALNIMPAQGHSDNRMWFSINVLSTRVLVRPKH